MESSTEGPFDQDALRELSRLIPDKSIVTQHASHDNTLANFSQWKPQGLDNVSNIMDQSLPPSSKAFDQSMAWNHSAVASTASAPSPSSASFAADTTSFHKIDSSYLNGTMLLDESLPHQLQNVSASISFFQPSECRQIRKSPSKLAKTQPAIAEDDEDGSMEQDTEPRHHLPDFSRVIPVSRSQSPEQRPPMMARTPVSNENARPTPFPPADDPFLPR